MTEIYSFFNSTPDDRRPKQAEDWANYFSKFLTTGLYHKNAEAGLAVTSDAQMRVLVDAGAAFFSGYMYENTAPLPLTVPLADNNRIDRVVVRLNLNEDQRNIRAHIKQGTEDEPPELQR
ncbi:structural protein [Geomicrobium sp. JCM 19037]|uniref:hypothetical protein n=1 Tax=Geomicrobium sp. JCM 19037 TaxID=1460634 RepID=UPI00045F1D2A|nr:hypothetical protein [Geomicrobium sp. JCM 19037]GAK03127.1 structural protein [Geomicrobium sp. JCM 19037]